MILGSCTSGAFSILKEKWISHTFCTFSIRWTICTIWQGCATHTLLYCRIVVVCRHAGWTSSIVHTFLTICHTSCTGCSCWSSTFLHIESIFTDITRICFSTCFAVGDATWCTISCGSVMKSTVITFFTRTSVVALKAIRPTTRTVSPFEVPPYIALQAESSIHCAHQAIGMGVCTLYARTSVEEGSILTLCTSCWSISFWGTVRAKRNDRFTNFTSRFVSVQPGIGLTLALLILIRLNDKTFVGTTDITLFGGRIIASVTSDDLGTWSTWVKAWGECARNKEKNRKVHLQICH